jgi:hypothetical protein
MVMVIPVPVPRVPNKLSGREGTPGVAAVSTCALLTSQTFPLISSPTSSASPRDLTGLDLVAHSTFLGSAFHPAMSTDRARS